MATKERFLALDVFRGLTICFMIIVNSPGGPVSYSPLLHAAWHGFTPTDLVFPSFLFAVGNAMAFTVDKFAAAGDGFFWTKTIKRTMIIFLLGYLLYWFPFFHEGQSGGWELKPIGETRIMGVLQRIALCYFFASVVIHYGSVRFAFWFSAFALLGYWIVMYFLGDYTMLGNAGMKLDVLIFGENHLYHGEGVAFDPEGLLSTLPAIVNVIGGYFAGQYIRSQGYTYETIAKLMMAGAVLVLLAFTWDMAFPINKKLWTPAFVLLTVGLDLVILSVLIYVIGIRENKRWTYFFEVFGRNPLFIYLLSEVLLITMDEIDVGNITLHTWIYERLLLPIASPINASFLFAFLLMLTCWSVGYFLDKRRIYVRV